MSRAIFPGSFDPITLGHIDIVKRLSSVFSEVVILVADSTSKNRLFSAKERVDLAKLALKKFKNVTVESYDGLTVEYARENSPAVLVRALRGTSDFDYERNISEANRLLAPDVDTYFLFGRPEFIGIASSIVKEIAKNGGDLSKFVSPEVSAALKKKMK